MRFRKLRIAWSVGCGIACVLLIVLWVRSRWSGCSTNRMNGSAVMTSLGVMSGSVYFLEMDLKSRRANGLNIPTHGWDFQADDGKLDAEAPPNFALNSTPSTFIIKVPVWFLVLVLAVLAPIPWISTRFSLRALLIATTLVALVLGLVVWLR